MSSFFLVSGLVRREPRRRPRPPFFLSYYVLAVRIAGIPLKKQTDVSSSSGTAAQKASTKTRAQQPLLPGGGRGSWIKREEENMSFYQ